MTAHALRMLIGTAFMAFVVACGGVQPAAEAPGGAGTSSGSAAAGAATSSASTSNNGAPAATSAAATKTGAPTAGEGGASGAGGGGPSLACPLMTRDEARAILGVDVGEGAERGEPPREVAPGVTLTTTTCRYSATTGRSVTIGFERMSGPGVGEMRAGIRQQFDQSCQRDRVSGVGDVACWADPSHTQLRFLKGTTSVIVGVFQERTDPDRSEPLQAQGVKAAGRIQ